MQAYSSGSQSIKNNTVQKFGSEMEISGLSNRYQKYLMYPQYYTAENSTSIFASSTHPDNRGLVNSEDSGETWKNVFPLPVGSPLSSYKLQPNKFTFFWAVVGGINKLYLLRSDFSIHSEFSGMKNPFNPDLSIINPSLGHYAYGEYTNDGTKIWETKNYGQEWSILYDNPGIRHFHSLQIDPYTGDWWACAGDTDAQSRILRSQDSGVAWEIMQEGSQQSRVCGMEFSEDYIIYGTDAPSEQNYLYKTGRTQFIPEVISELTGPVFGIYRGRDGNFYFHTMAEGDGNEYSTICITDGTSVREIFRTFRNNPVQGGVHRMTKPDMLNRAMFGNKDAWDNALGLISIPIGKI